MEDIISNLDEETKNKLIIKLLNYAYSSLNIDFPSEPEMRLAGKKVILIEELLNIFNEEMENL